MSEHTFAFVDLAGFTALTEAHGDEEAVATLARFRTITNAALGTDGVLVKTIGDAVMLAFPSPDRAMAALRRMFDAAASDANLPLIRAGAHHGSALAEGGDYFGASVNLAARVAAQAGGGQLLATSAVALAARDAGEVVTHVGPTELRNIAAPVDLYEISFHVSAETAVDPVCAMKVPIGDPATVHIHFGDRDFWFCGLPCVATFASAPERYL
ncbi:MAG TPA: adenylate/guanylate cyclase domain-containing protein [Acidimicrobiia bacterium]|nr:adenylate/guanylate cyclase domain-containing protein [Acidimicrobiia bacterium]